MNRLQSIGTFEEQVQARRVQQQKQLEQEKQYKASWPSHPYNTVGYWGREFTGGQDIVEELSTLKFPGAYEFFMNNLQKDIGSPQVVNHYFTFIKTLSWVRGEVKHVASRRVGNCQVGHECISHKGQMYMSGFYRGSCAEEPAYTEAFEALVLAEMPAALAEKEAAVTAEALRRIKAEAAAAAAAAAAAEKQRVETARITALARQRIKQAAEKAAEEAAIQLEMARLLSTDETVAARIQLRGAELSGLF
jgi:hypothetical protein